MGDISYLILAHGSFGHLRRLIGALDGPGIHFFIHVDKKAGQVNPDTGENVRLVPDTARLSVFWGGIRMVDATLLLMRQWEREVGTGYVVLLSGQDYPIRPQSVIRERLSGDTEYINLLPAPQPGKPMERFRRYHFQYPKKGTHLVTRVLRKGEKMLGSILPRRRIPFRIYVGSSWFALTSGCVKHILAAVGQNPSFRKFFRYVEFPDEAFFQTIIAHSEFHRRVENNLTYTDWSTVPSPAWITEMHVDLFRSQESFENEYGTYTPVFARKFNDSSKEVTDLIDRTLLK